MKVYVFMRFSKLLVSFFSFILVLCILCSCSEVDLQLSEGQIEDIVSQLEEVEIDNVISQSEDKQTDESIPQPEKTDGKTTPKVDKKTEAIQKTESSKTNTSSVIEIQSGGNSDLYNPDDYNSQNPYEDEDYANTENQINTPSQEGNIRKITSLEDLKEFANTVRCGHSYQGEEVTLETDIDLSGMEWTPIGSYKKPFKGTFSGKGHKISNMTISSVTEQMTERGVGNTYVGFFGYAEDAVITGLHLENVNINLSNQFDADFINIGSVVGYMMSRSKGIKLTKCSASGNINVSDSQEKIVEIGGIAGGFDANQKNTFYNMCLLYSDVNITCEGYVFDVGGISGIINSRDSDISDSFISDLIYIGNINDEKVKRSKVGGLFGVYNSGYRCNIKNCFVKLTLKRIGYNSYAELKPNLGIIIGDQCVSTAELGLENVYGCVYYNDEYENMPMVGRTHNKVYYKNCLETNSVPKAADSFLINWNLTDRTLPKIAFEQH